MLSMSLLIQFLFKVDITEAFSLMISLCVPFMVF